VFSHYQITHFRTFGFLVLPGLLGADETAGLTGEVTEALTEAFGALGTDTDPEGTGGIRGDYLPLSVDRAPISQSLIADDQRLFQGAADLLGCLVVPAAPVATCFTSNAWWHTDQGPDIGGVQGPDIGGVKFLAHLQPRTAETGALRVVPGSHEPGFARRIAEYRHGDPAGQGFEDSGEWLVPGLALATEPGDVIAFDAHLLHCSAGGSKRLAWSIEYLPWPGLADRDRLRTVRDLILDADYDDEEYDRDRWPAWREWAAGAGSIPSRNIAVQRLRLLGVLAEKPG
jgi:Phytanoyl-CoA dioxygenase (PhyH)